MKNQNELDLQFTESKRKDIEEKYQSILDEKQKMIDVIDAHFKQSIDPLSSELTQLDETIKQLKNTIKKDSIVDRWNSALSKGSIDENYFESMLSFMQIHDHYLPEYSYEQKKSPQEGIQVWKIENKGYHASKLYMAFYKGQLIGTSYRVTARHAGDYTEPFSFIGDWADESRLKMDKTSPFGRKYSEWMTFTEWMKRLKTIDVESTESLKMSDPETTEMIKNGLSNWY